MTRNCFLFLLIICAGRIAFAQSRENFIPNPGFEDEWKHWIPGTDPNGTVAIDDNVSHSGKRSLRFKYNPTIDTRLSVYMMASNTINAVLKPGHAYTFSGWIKIADVPADKDGPFAYLCEAHSNRGAATVVHGNTDPTKNDGWVFVSQRYVVPPDAIGHQLRCQCHAAPSGAAGTVWFDDLKLEEGETASAFRPDCIDFSDLYTYESGIPWLPVPDDFRSSLAVVTPHVEQARSYAGGAPRMLWAGFYNNARIGCELAERGDLTLDSVVFNGSNVDMTDLHNLHFRCVEMFRRRLGIEPALPPERAVNVLVIEQGILEILNQADRAAIVERIAHGIGCVVLLGPIHSPPPGHPGAVVTPKIAELIHAADALPQPGHGHVVVAMNAVQNRLWSHGTFGIESAYSEILQAIYKSIGRPPVAVGVNLWPQKPIAGKSWTATVFGKAASVRCRVIVDLPVDWSTLNEGYGETVPRTIVGEGETLSSIRGPADARVAMRGLTSGTYMLLAQTLDEQKRVTGWSIVPFTVESSVEIMKIDAGKAAFVANEPLHVSCTVKNYYKRIPDARLATQIKDPRGRLLYRAIVPISIPEGQSTHDIVVSLAHAEHSSVELEVSLESHNSSANAWIRQSHTSQWLSSEQLTPKVDFHVGPYDDFNLGWRDLGGDMNVGPPVPDLGQRPYLWTNVFRPMGPHHSCCDPDSIAKAEKYVAESLAGVAPWTPIGCILHDELDDYGFGTSENVYEVEFFRQYLRETYKDLPALNKSWGTSYTDWNEIDTKPTKINFLTQSDRSPAPWADWQAASELAAHKFYAAMDRAARKVNPALGVGPSGTRNTTGVNGIDWWLLSHDFRSITFYPGVHDEIYRSFAPQGRMMANWSHLDTLHDSDWLRVRIWQDVLAQCGGTPVYGGRYSNVFFPDYRPKPSLAAYVEELADIRRGFARLISGLRRNDSAVAIFYSPSSYRARIVEMKDYQLYHAADLQNDLLTSLAAALADARIGSHFVSYEQVAKGELDPKKTKCLFMWGASALSAGEADAIWNYINAGGTVIADSEPGLYDEHCHRLPIGPFHKCLVNGTNITHVGRGSFVLYRDLPSNYAASRGYQYEGSPAPPPTATPETSKTLLQSSSNLKAKLAAAAGIEPAFRLCDDKGQDFAHKFSAFDYMDGSAHYVACVPEDAYGSTLDAAVTISEPFQNKERHLYSCRQGKYLGTSAGTHNLKLRASTANLFAVLPYKVERLDLAATASATLGQPIDFRAMLVAGNGPFVRHVIVAQLRLPDGRELPEHQTIVETNNGHAEGRIWLAYNDSPGKCTLIVRDVATGVQATKAVDVQIAR